MAEDSTINIFKNYSEDPEPESEGFNLPGKIKSYVNIKSKVAREFLGELFGTMILCLFAVGSGFQLKFQKTYSPGDNNVVSANLSGGFGLTLAIIFTGKLSGAHVNPAISFAMLLTGRMNFFRFLIYILAQLIGAFLAAFILFIEYYDAIKAYGDDKKMDLIGLFGTFPVDDKRLGIFNGFFDLVLGASLLVMVVLALTDKNNGELSHGATAILAGIAIFVIESSFGYNTGNALNPARDFSPRLFSAIAGWGGAAFSNGRYFFWCPLVGPMVGSFVGVLIYSVMIGNNLY